MRNPLQSRINITKHLGQLQDLPPIPLHYEPNKTLNTHMIVNSIPYDYINTNSHDNNVGTKPSYNEMPSNT